MPVIYEYTNHKGERLEILASMKRPPKPKIRRRGRTWYRVYGDVQGHMARGDAPHFAKEIIPNIAPSLPDNDSPYRVTTRNGVKVREHADGSFSTAKGIRIIENESHMKRVCEQTGRTWEKD